MAVTSRDRRAHSLLFKDTSSYPFHQIDPQPSLSRVVPELSSSLVRYFRLLHNGLKGHCSIGRWHLVPSSFRWTRCAAYGCVDDLATGDGNRCQLNQELSEFKAPTNFFDPDRGQKALSVDLDQDKMVQSADPPEALGIFFFTQK